MIEAPTRRPRGRPPGSKNQVVPVSGNEQSGTVSARKDAVLNRQKLIDAASQVMRETGGDVPFEAIAVQAGVTRGTLYRNFTDRQALYEAVLDHDLDAMIADIAGLPDDDTLGFLLVLTELMVVYDKFLAVLPMQLDYKADGVSEAKIAAVIALPLARAKRQGVLRADLTGDDIVLAARMMSGNWRLDHKADFRAAFDVRLKLVVGGLGGPSAATGVVPRTRRQP